MGGGGSRYAGKVALLTGAAGELGGLDLLVNNAGIDGGMTPV
jgi:NAD(P)-dependent dehydrogenase (short-subunit alcohol dehydrogenase family)